MAIEATGGQQSVQGQEGGTTNYARPIVYAAITAVALAGIGAVTLGLLSYFGVVSLGGLNAWASWTLMGVGAGAIGFSVLGALGGVLRSGEREDEEDSVEESVEQRVEVQWPATDGGTVTRNIVTWNVGTDSDYRLVRLRETKDTPALLAEQITQIHKDRVDFLKEAFSQMGSLDIVCLQETFDFTPQELQEILGNNFTVQAEDNSGRLGDTLVAWNTDKLRLQQSCVTSLNYGTQFSAGALLEDLETHVLFRVASGHISGFGLDTLEEHRKEAATGGDGELREITTAFTQDLGYDVAILGMDANVTRGIWSQRLKIAEDAGFITDITETTSTIHVDKLEREEKLDYIYARANEECEVARFTQISRPACTGITSEQNPSDHSPVITQITLRSQEITV